MPRAAATQRRFQPSFFAFLRDLKRHNTREWFAANRERYVADIETPMLTFITDVGARLPSISSAFVADPRRSGGSMYRIYRDTRFSADKSPFKTWVAAHFRHRAARKDQATPGFYLHLSPTDCFGGGGIYHPDTATLTRIRQRIVGHPKAWAAVLRSGVTIEGERLTRAPAGFDPSHRYVEDLKWKDLYAGSEFRVAQVTRPDFLEQFLESCRQVSPLVEFLTRAIDLRW